MLEVTRFGITSRFDASPWPNEVPSLYRPFLKNQFYEQTFLDYIRSLKLRGIYVDAGSCLGTHTVWFALYCLSTRVYAFEPRERFARWTQMNVDANALASKVTVHRVGLGDRKGDASSELDGKVETFPIERLDRIVPGDDRVAVIKVDVEGMEDVVLRGAASILRRSRPLVFAEAFTKQEYDKIESILSAYGYRATGRVFNSTPTYEFVARPTLRHRVRGWARKLPPPIRRPLIALRDRWKVSPTGG